MRIFSKTPTPTALLRDESLEGWVCWREACEDVHDSYELWSDARGPQRGLGYETYRAALEREETAASVLEMRAKRLTVESAQDSTDAIDVARTRAWRSNERTAPR
jgi:hypothetical protein